MNEKVFRTFFFRFRFFLGKTICRKPPPLPPTTNKNKSIESRWMEYWGGDRIVERELEFLGTTNAKKMILKNVMVRRAYTSSARIKYSFTTTTTGRLFELWRVRGALHSCHPHTRHSLQSIHFVINCWLFIALSSCTDAKRQKDDSETRSSISSGLRTKYEWVSTSSGLAHNDCNAKKTLFMFSQRAHFVFPPCSSPSDGLTAGQPVVHIFMFHFYLS